MLPDNWLGAMKAIGVRRVAIALGISVDPEPRRGLRPCPACHAEARGSSDRRGPAEITSDGGGWHCYRCDAKGSAIDLASWQLLGVASPSGHGWEDLRDKLESCGLRIPSSIGTPSSHVSRAPPPQPIVVARPPHTEVSSLWDSCIPVVDDPELAEALRRRHLDPTAITDGDHARALPRSVALPPWASFRGRSWVATDHRLLLPLVGERGGVESLHARTLDPVVGSPKGLSPKDFSVRGLVFADALARLVLAEQPLGDGSSSAELVRSAGLVIAEGVPDFLTWATHWGDANESAPAVMGIISGSLTSELVARIPNGARVAVRQHADTAGAKYTARIIQALAARCRVHVLAGKGAA